MRLPIAAAALALTSLAVARTQAETDLCPCGYTVDYASHVFTELFESDFLHVSSLSGDDESTFIPQAYNVTPNDANGFYGKASRVENVVTNPLEDMYSWNGTGVKGGDPGLQLWVKKDLIPVPETSNNSMVPMAEIVSARDDILYGSFRIAMKTTSVRGTCGAFFYYRNDSSEIDMEFLSSDQDASHGTVNLVIQSAQSAENGYVEPGSNDFENKVLSFNPNEGYHEYRFDWLPKRVNFYVDGHKLHTIESNIPRSPGAIHISHWSNGNPGWSEGPPDEDALLTISYFKAYFNSSKSDVMATSTELCEPGQKPNSTCFVPYQTLAPEPSGRHGNVTGHTHFFTEDLKKSHPEHPPRPSPDGPSEPKPSTSKGNSQAEQNALFRLDLQQFLSVASNIGLVKLAMQVGEWLGIPHSRIIGSCLILMLGLWGAVPGCREVYNTHGACPFVIALVVGFVSWVYVTYIK